LPLTSMLSLSSWYMNHAIARVLTLLTQWTRRPWSLAALKAGMRIAIKMAIIAITTNSSISVNPVRNIRFFLFGILISNGVKALFFISFIFPVFLAKNHFDKPREKLACQCFLYIYYQITKMHRSSVVFR